VCGLFSRNDEAEHLLLAIMDDGTNYLAVRRGVLNLRGRIVGYSSTNRLGKSSSSPARNRRRTLINLPANRPLGSSLPRRDKSRLLISPGIAHRRTEAPAVSDRISGRLHDAFCRRRATGEAWDSSPITMPSTMFSRPSHCSWFSSQHEKLASQRSLSIE
jgi:hypothetical protein